MRYTEENMMSYSNEKLKKTKSFTHEAQYNRDYHPGKVYELWGQGLMHHRKICALLRISERTLKKWLTDHVEFAHQYYLGIPRGQTRWIDHGLKNIIEKGFQHKTYEMLINLAFDSFKERKKVLIPKMKNAKTIAQKAQAINSLFACGDYSAEEIRCLAQSIVESAAGMGEYEKVQEQLDFLKEQVLLQTGNRKVSVEGDIYEAETIPVEKVEKLK